MNNTENPSDAILYKSTIIIKPKPFFTFRKPEVTTMKITNDEIVFGTDPKTIIPFHSISKIKFNQWFSSKIKVFLTDGQIYSIIWASGDKDVAFKYNLLETAHIFNNLKRIIK